MLDKILTLIQENQAITLVTLVGIVFLFLLALACVLFDSNEPYATITSSMLFITALVNAAIVNLFT